MLSSSAGRNSPSLPEATATIGNTPLEHEVNICSHLCKYRRDASGANEHVVGQDAVPSTASLSPICVLSLRLASRLLVLQCLESFHATFH
eukprot:5169408-Prymnesium_polylepis.1